MTSIFIAAQVSTSQPNPGPERSRVSARAKSVSRTLPPNTIQDLVLMVHPSNPVKAPS